MTFTAPGKLIAEALVLAVAFVVVFFAIHAAFMAVWKEKAMTNHALLAGQVAIAAASFHVLCEYTGINGWYCDNRPE